MAWNWAYESATGEDLGQSEVFDNRGDAETWIGASFDELLEQGIAQVRLLEDGSEVYGPMSLSLD